MAICEVCFHHCNLEDGKLGLCFARRGEGDRVVCDNYGMVTSIALDPIEKKPLYHFHPGSRILSVGSYGCNLRCPFCQNFEISYSDTVKNGKVGVHYVSPDELVRISLDEKVRGNIGVAFTYNEPLVGYEYVRDAAKAVKAAGQSTVLVTNGTATSRVEDELLPYIDAMNVDLKAFSDHFYDKLIGGNRQMVMDFIKKAVEYGCHMEVTTLIIPGENDSEEEMSELSGFISDIDENIVLHITRFFPRYHMTDRGPTDVTRLLRLCEIARKKLNFVYPGNV